MQSGRNRMEEAKWLKTLQIYENYERRFAEARLKKAREFPLPEGFRQEIRRKTAEMLKVREEYIPEIHAMTEVARHAFPTYDVIQLRYETWENCWAAASFYLPHGEEKLPLVFLFCGHGALGRLTPSYRMMAHYLAENGFAVIVPDNIGQGDREKMGHKDCIAPFWCGLTLQGMIVMESLALIRYMEKHPRVDPARMASCGNSGGGTLNLLLAAFEENRLAAIAASGYPSEFHYILAKERFHCACNLLPGCACGPEMWEILSAFAPRPLLIEQGENDSLIPYDYFMRCARKVRYAYRCAGAEENFQSAVTKETHSWTPADIRVIADFLAKSLGTVCGEVELDVVMRYDAEAWHVAMPPNAFTAAEIAERLTGKRTLPEIKLEDIYPPRFRGERITAEDIIPNIGRGDVMRIWAQMECALAENTEN